MTLFDRIKQRGEIKGYSVAKIEELAGMSPNSLYKWKTQTPKIDKVNAIADILDVSTDYLLGREEQTKKDPLTYYRMDTSGMTEDQIKILREKLEFAERLAREDIRRAKGE